MNTKVVIWLIMVIGWMAWLVTMCYLSLKHAWLTRTSRPTPCPVPAPKRDPYEPREQYHWYDIFVNPDWAGLHKWKGVDKRWVIVFAKSLAKLKQRINVLGSALNTLDKKL
jgi:hypothetical protein